MVSPTRIRASRPSIRRRHGRRRQQQYCPPRRAREEDKRVQESRRRPKTRATRISSAQCLASISNWRRTRWPKLALRSTSEHSANSRDLNAPSVGLRLRLLPRWQGNTSCHCHSGRDTNAEEQRWLVTPCLTSGWNHRSRAQMPQILPRARPRRRRRGRGRHGMPRRFAVPRAGRVLL